MKKQILLVFLVIILAVAVSAYYDASWKPVGSCPDSPFCINSSFPLTKTVNLSGKSSQVHDWSMDAIGKGTYKYRFASNRTGNSTEYGSDYVNVTMFAKTGIVPLVVNNASGDPMLTNSTSFLTCNLSGSSSCIVDYVILTNGATPTPSNWTFFFVTNRTGNSTIYSSSSVIVTFTTTATPSVPSLLTPVNDSRIVEDCVNLSWSHSTNANNYSVYIDHSFSSMVDAVRNSVVYCPVADGNYSWKVNATNNIGSSAFSENRTFEIDIPLFRTSLSSNFTNNVSVEYATNFSFNANYTYLINSSVVDNAVCNVTWDGTTYDLSWNGYYYSSLNSSGHNLGFYSFDYDCGKTNLTLQELGGNMTIVDTVAPVISNILDSDIEYGGREDINATITDYFMGTAYMNINPPAGSGEQYLMTNVSSLYNHSFFPNLTGVYAYNMTANDTSNNIKISSTGTFTVSDTASPVWSGNTSSPVSPVLYNPLERYEFNISFSDVFMSNVTFAMVNGTNLNFTSVGSGQVLNATFVGLGVNSYSYHWCGRDISNNVNCTANFTYVVSKFPTNVSLFLNNSQGNLSQTWGEYLNMTAYATNGSVYLHVNGTNVSNPFIGGYSAGVWNVTAFTDGNANYTGSYASRTLTVIQLPVNITLFLNNAQDNLSQVWGDYLNVTSYPASASPTVLFNGTNEGNPFTGYYSAGVWNVTAYVDGNANQTGDVVIRNLTIYRQNTSVELKINSQVGNKTVSQGISLYFNLTLFGSNGSLLNRTISFWNNFSGGDSVQMQSKTSPLNNWTNSTDLRGIYVVSGKFAGDTNLTSYAVNYTVTVVALNVTFLVNTDCWTNFTYTWVNVTNNTQQGIQPYGQNSTCGIFNVTLSTEGSDANGSLRLKLNATIGNVTIKIGNSSNYTNAMILNTSYRQVYENLTRGSSIYLWHWVDLNNATAGTKILLDLIWEAVVS